MATSDTLFAGSIPDLYDRLLVPLIFEPYARDLAKRVSATKPQVVLETAAGTGAVTRALASSLADAPVFPQDPPRFLARTPHGYCDRDRIREELNTAGFGAVSIETVDARSKGSSALDVAVAFCQGTPLRNEIESRGAPSLEEATHHAAKALTERFGAKAIDGRMRAIVMTASR
jgi:hypothetical protein